MAAEIQAIFDAENGVWGARRITAELNDPTHRDGATTPAKRINRKKVARLMQAQNLFGLQNKRRVKTIRARQVPRGLPPPAKPYARGTSVRTSSPLLGAATAGLGRAPFLSPSPGVAFCAIPAAYRAYSERADTSRKLFESIDS